MKDNLLTVKDVVARLNLSRRQVYRIIKGGELRAFKVGPRLIRVTREDFREYLKSRGMHYRLEKFESEI